MQHNTALNIPISSAITQPGDLLELTLLTTWLEAANTGLVVLDSDSAVVMMNSSAGVLLSAQTAESIGKPIKGLLANVEQWPQLILWLDSAPTQAQRQITIRPLNHRTGQALRYANLKICRMHAQGQVWRILALSDVSELVIAQLAVEENRRQWQALNAGVVIADATQPDMPIVFVNTAFEAMTGYSREETLGRNCRFMQGADTDQPGLQTLRRALSAKTNGYAILRNYRKDGSLFYNELFISPVRNEAGIVTHFVGIQHVRDERYRDEPGLLGEQAIAKFGTTP